MTDDVQLLQRYAETRCEDSFAELVRRHLPLVYAAALRQVNGAVHRAEDVAQAVFVELARNARPLSRRTEIVGWLYTVTHYTAAKLKRGELRRQMREQEASFMQEMSVTTPADNGWETVRPFIDAAMHDLNEHDRDLILRRFFQGQRFPEIGRYLGTSEDAARMRLERALDRLRHALARREVTSTTAALALVLAHQPAVAASASLAATITGVALAEGAAGAVGAWSFFMNVTPYHLGATAALAIAATAGLLLQVNSNATGRAEARLLESETIAGSEIRAENGRLLGLSAEVRELQRDDGKLGQLNDEAVALRARLQRLNSGEQAVSGVAQQSTPMDRLPSPQFQARPFYPMDLRARGVTGEVWVQFKVDANGEVQDASAIANPNDPAGTEATHVAQNSIRLAAFTVVAAAFSPAATESTATSSSDRAMLESTALAAVRQWRFKPGQKGGRAVTTTLQVPIVFVLN